MVPTDLLRLIVCPKCHGDIRETKNGESVVCAVCRLEYAIVDGIPDMLLEDAKPIG